MSLFIHTFQDEDEMKDGADEMQVESDEMETDHEEDVSDWENKEQNTSKILRYLKEY